MVKYCGHLLDRGYVRCSELWKPGSTLGRVSDSFQYITYFIIFELIILKYNPYTKLLKIVSLVRDHLEHITSYFNTLFVLYGLIWTILVFW